jgi:DNA-binding protein HU-beta
MTVSKPKTKASTAASVRAKTKQKVAARSATTSAKTSAPAKSAVKTVTLKQIGVDLAAAHELPKRTVEALLNDMTDVIVKTIKKGSKVRISGIGILQVKKRAARMGRNPATGEAIKIKASKKVSLSVARDLKESL